MSIRTIKNTLETHLRDNLTDIAIKWNNTNYYTKNAIPLTQNEIEALTFFVEPKIIPIDQSRELMGTLTPFNYEVFMQLDIYVKKEKGTGSIYTAIELIDAIFKEEIINGVLCPFTKTIGSFNNGDWHITPHRVKAEVRAS